MMGKVALVTGGSRGIGAAIASLFRARGAVVIAPSHSELDLASRDSIDSYVATLAAPVDILVNNAGINVLAGLEETSREVWDQMVQVDLTAPLELSQRLVGGMKRRGWGRILNVSSVFSLVTRERRCAYSAVKAGLNGLSRSMALELAPSGILVNALCPGYVETDLTRANNSSVELREIARTIPLGRLATPADVAKIAVFLCSDDNAYITGQMVVADGGFLLR